MTNGASQNFLLRTIVRSIVPPMFRSADMARLSDVLAHLRPGANFADVDGTLASVRWDSPVELPTQAEVDLTVARIDKMAEIDAALETARQAGVEFGGKVLQVRNTEDLTNIASQALRALAAATQANAVWWDEPVARFVMADNTALPLTAEQMLDMAQAASDRIVAIRFQYRALKTAVLQAATVQGIAAIEVTFP